MWKNIVDLRRPQMAIWRMSIACWIPKATHTQHTHTLSLSLRLSGYVILTAFPVQQWLHKRVSVVHFGGTCCLYFQIDFIFTSRFHSGYSEYRGSIYLRNVGKNLYHTVLSSLSLALSSKRFSHSGISIYKNPQYMLFT